MASSTATSRPQRSAFRSKLTPEQKAAFDELAEILASPGADLERYRALGDLVARMIPPVSAGRGEIRWLRGPAAALNCSHTHLQKALRFRQEYPHRKDVRALQKLHVKWTLVNIAMAVPNKEDRHKLLEEAADKNWCRTRCASRSISGTRPGARGQAAGRGGSCRATGRR
jgi:hypothetical protein